LAHDTTHDGLQWPELLQELASHCKTGEAERSAVNLLPVGSRITADELLDQTEQALTLLIENNRPPLSGTGQVTDNLEAATKGAVLDGRQLGELAHFIRAASLLRSYCERNRELTPALAEVAMPIEDYRSLASDILRSFSNSGELLDSASPKLASLRRETRELAVTLKRRIDSLLRDRDLTTFLQESYYTIREDRYVLPVKAEFSGKVSGIVHGTSSSGATMFVEPADLIDQNNRLKTAEMEVRREEYRILAELTARIASNAPGIRSNLRAYAELDLIFARANLALEMGCERPHFTETQSFLLEGARHPLLLLQRMREDGKKSRVIPNDLNFNKRGLIITGPNAGGKTVFMKMLGLFALMTRTGLFPSAEKAELAFFTGVLTDIGDPQSITGDLSFFSGHMVSLNSIVNSIGKNSLVLLDEIAGGTDPAEGAALARSLIEEMAGRGAIVVVTTHYHALKGLPFEDDRFVNLAAEFNPEDNYPTYRLNVGTPGRSCAIDVASNLGLPQSLIERAKQLLDEGDRSIDAVIAGLEEERQKITGVLEQIEEERDRLKQEQQQHRQAIEKLDHARKDVIEKEKDRFAADIKQARRKIAETIENIRDTGESVRIAGKTLDAIERDVRDKIPHAPAPTTEYSPVPGEIVFVSSLNRQAKVLELPDKSGKVKIEAGPLKMSVFAADCRSTDRKKVVAAAPKFSPAAGEAQQEIDLRGMRVDEAITEIDRAIDGALLRDQNSLLIIHGHGTGALKKSIRQYLREIPAISKFRAGASAEGGDGVTVITFR
jgi:DNA mismatch repair protein MutS2